MIIPADHLRAQAQATGFRVEILEKVFHLLNLLSTANTHPA